MSLAFQVATAFVVFIFVFELATQQNDIAYELRKYEKLELVSAFLQQLTEVSSGASRCRQHCTARRGSTEAFR